MITQTEDKLQQDIYMWYNNTYCLKHHSPRGLIYSNVNEGMSAVANESIRQLRRLKLNKTLITTIVGVIMKTLNILVSRFKYTGYTIGVSDLVVILPNSKVLFIELKKLNGIQSDVQKQFEERVLATGNEYHIIRSLDQFKELVNVQLSK